ncbi:MAG: Smr/MutS family protein [Saprospiraceae bacterium]|jgi:dsDNA-specific endonuclease/ATPase MutS2|nr:hypothetical protein [Chitinophagia bacterium]
MTASEIKELWIGDKIRSSKSGLSGRFGGLNDSGMVRMNAGHKIILVPTKFVELVQQEDVEEESLVFEDQSQTSSEHTEHTRSELDLHIEVLRPDLLNALPERIVDVQIRAFENYLEKAIEKNLRQILVIHGRGQGVLRHHIHKSLESRKEVFQFRLLNNDGATEIILY